MEAEEGEINQDTSPSSTSKPSPPPDSPFQSAEATDEKRKEEGEEQKPDVLLDLSLSSNDSEHGSVLELNLIRCLDVGSSHLSPEMKVVRGRGRAKSLLLQLLPEEVLQLSGTGRPPERAQEGEDAGEERTANGSSRCSAMEVKMIREEK